MATTIEECKQLVEAQRASGKVYMMMETVVYSREYLFAKELYDRGELGRIQCNKQPAKSAREVHAGDLLQIRTEGADFEVEVLSLSDVRGPARVAQTLYKETEQSQELRLKVAAERKAMMDFNPAPMARPSKRSAFPTHRLRARLSPTAVMY